MRVGVARGGEHLGIVRRTIGFRGAMPELRSQMTARQPRARLVDLETAGLVNDAEMRSAVLK